MLHAQLPDIYGPTVHPPHLSSTLAHNLCPINQACIGSAQTSGTGVSGTTVLKMPDTKRDGSDLNASRGSELSLFRVAPEYPVKPPPQCAIKRAFD